MKDCHSQAVLYAQSDEYAVHLLTSKFVPRVMSDGKVRLKAEFAGERGEKFALVGSVSGEQCSGEESL